MKKLNKTAILMVLAGLLISCADNEKETGELELPFYNKADFTPEWIDENDPAYKTIHTIGNFEFTNQHGTVITRKDIKGKICIANFFFTSCAGICPRMMHNMMKIQKEFRNDESLIILSHSVTPVMDSVPVLYDYAENNDITSNNWHLLTGSKKEIYTTARESYFADEGFGKSVTLEDDFLHTENIVLIDSKNRIRGVYNGLMPLQVTQLIKDVYLLKNDSQH